MSDQETKDIRCFVCGSANVDVLPMYDVFCTGQPADDCTCLNCGADWLMDEQGELG